MPKTYSAPTSRDDRLHICTLYYDGGWTVDNLRVRLPKFTEAQLYYALEHRPTPQKHACGRYNLLDTPHRKELIK